MRAAAAPGGGMQPGSPRAALAAARTSRAPLPTAPTHDASRHARPVLLRPKAITPACRLAQKCPRQWPLAPAR